jgi:4-alpha-glucanotransferase
VRFHQWLQWLIDRQLAEAGQSIALIQDLPVGFDGAGADAWMWQDQLAPEVRVGSPPDEYSIEGQNWGLPPFIPHRLRAAGYEPFIQTIRASLRHSHGLRIDHVMGLFRLFWIPAGFHPGAGTFVRYPVEDLLAIVALESQRAAAVIVGEDLGTVEAGVRERLAESSILSYRLLWFEPNPPEQYPAAALTAITTHDLPTVAGLWTGADLEEQKQLGLLTNDEGTRGIRERLCQFTGLEGNEPVAEVVVRAHAALARTPSLWMTATLEDAAGVVERPNIPGTTEDQRPNWSIALPVTLEELEHSSLPRRIAGALRCPAQ